MAIVNRLASGRHYPIARPFNRKVYRDVHQKDENDCANCGAAQTPSGALADDRRRDLEAARKLLARDGFDATSTTRIADAAGVSVGSLYEYFASKDALVAKLIKCHCDYLFEQYAQAFKAVEGQGIERVVDAWVDTTADAYALDVALQRVLLEHMGRVSKLRHLSRVSLVITDLLEQG